MNADVKSKYDKRVSSIVNQLLDGGSDEYKERLMMCPFDLILAPIHVPMWMFRKYDDHPELNLTDIEKICLSVAIHFTKVSSPTGYMECSGLVEKYCLCDVSDVDNAFRNLLSKKLVLYKTLNPEQCYDHKRNRGFVANIPKLREILSNYNMSVWT